jgi:16S rRNA (cytosine1402-N4)-methyltransferase
MLAEVLAGFKPVSINKFYEGTVGAGGHAKEILSQHPEIIKYFACDQDPNALELAKTNLTDFENKLEWIHGNFSDLKDQLTERNELEVDGFFLT